MERLASLERFARQAHSYLLERIKVRLNFVLQSDSQVSSEERQTLLALLELLGETELVEQASFIWFNRLCAWRYMDLKKYTRTALVSADADSGQPEVLASLKAGIEDIELAGDPAESSIMEMLERPWDYENAQGQMYRLRLQAACRYWQQYLPFLFSPDKAWADCLLPDGLLSVDGFLVQMSSALTEQECASVEVIGWLYQYYISERKEAVYAKLRGNGKVEAEEIPAATELFTPEWIVRYLIDNSLGRIWLHHHPSSKLRERLRYYIEPESEAEVPEITSPEELTICDPSCGSAHMLVYAFDVLWDIYEECGYSSAEIAGKILENNLYGLDIDTRSGQLASFALAMKARERDYQFFGSGISPHILVYSNINFAPGQFEKYAVAMELLAPGLLPASAAKVVTEFGQAKQFGSLIRPSAVVTAEQIAALEGFTPPKPFAHSHTHRLVLLALQQACCLSRQYLVVVTNPPYMGNGNMNAGMTSYMNRHYADTKMDLCCAFIQRGLELAHEHGFVAMITMHSWMFLSSFTALRERILQRHTLVSLAHLGTRGFGSIGGAVVATAAFVIAVDHWPGYRGSFVRLVEAASQNKKMDMFGDGSAVTKSDHYYTLSAQDFAKLPGSPVAYWVSPAMRQVFAANRSIDSVAAAVTGLGTSDNARFLRQWFEVSFADIGFDIANREQAQASGLRWFPCNKGGPFRKWYGNRDYIVNWENDGAEIRNYRDAKGKVRSRPQNMGYYFQEAISWSYITSALSSFRLYETGFINNNASPAIFGLDEDLKYKCLCYLNSQYVVSMIKVLNPTLHFDVGYFKQLPLPVAFLDKLDPAIGRRLVAIAKQDWDSQELSWHFATSPFLDEKYRDDLLEFAYSKMRSSWQQLTSEMQELETSVNRLFIETYQLSGQLCAQVPLNEVTVTCNPLYRYGTTHTESELEDLLRADTVRELVSYAVGCMFGRYAVDKPGLILASQGQTMADYNQIVYQAPDGSQNRFPPSPDNIVTITADSWGASDICCRFEEFISRMFGAKNRYRNVTFVEQALGQKLPVYFAKQFYADHLRRYRKRPIYWMFSSSQGTFRALVYVHRYDHHTMPRLVADYLETFLDQAQQAQLNYEHMLPEQMRCYPRSQQSIRKRLAWLKKIIPEVSQYGQKLADMAYGKDYSKLDMDLGIKANYERYFPNAAL